jgi:hypothetical protein
MAWLEQRCEEWDALVVREEEKAKGDLASTLGNSQRIRRLRWRHVGWQVTGSAG